jgi:hypothetical protein
MASAFAVRAQIEATLAERISSALTPAPRTIRPVAPTGVAAVDELLGGGLPVGELTEMIGAECSGRTELALSFVAKLTQADKFCAWVDVSNALSPESAAACGVDLARLLWVRCGVVQTVSTQLLLERTAKEGKESFSVPKKYFMPKPVIKGLHGGGMGGHPRGEARGMENAVSGLLRPDAIAARCAEAVKRVKTEREVVEAVSAAPAKGSVVLRAPGKPWSRIEQALRATDLLLQAGGFGTIVLDMGSIAPEHVSRIPLATWFRYRAAAERTQSSVLLLTQHACSKSSAGLVLRLRNEDAITQGTTVLAGFGRHIEISRQRFAQCAENAENVVPIRKPPQRAGVAMWRSRTIWAGWR